MRVRDTRMEISLTKVKVAGFSVSLDGFAAGPAQSLEHPLGLRGEEIFQWFFPTRTFRQMLGKEGGTTGVDDRFGQRAMEGFGAFILGQHVRTCSGGMAGRSMERLVG
jgi:hypothetical protein